MKSTDDGFLLEEIQEDEITSAISTIIAANIDKNELRNDFDYRRFGQKAKQWLSEIVPEGEVG
jgi:hypothetical protein